MSKVKHMMSIGFYSQNKYKYVTSSSCHVFIHAEQELPRRRLNVSVHVVSQDGSRLDQQRERSR